MADTASDKGLILALLEERDRLYQHNARLQSKLDELESADVKMTSYKQTIEEQKLIIEKKERKIGQLEYQLQYLRRKQKNGDIILIEIKNRRNLRKPQKSVKQKIFRFVRLFRHNLI
jgi:hypothetical protein